MATLTKKQKAVYDFVKTYINKRGFSPTFEEIKKHFKLSALSGVHQHIETLEEKGFLTKSNYSARGIELSNQNEQMVQIPLLGTIAAGQPLTLFDTVSENIAVPKNKLPNSSNSNIYALKVAGNSMIEENIHDGDTILVRHQNTAENGQKIVALVDGGATLKKFYKEQGQVRLQPANKKMEPIIVRRGQDFHIQGIMLDVIQSGSTTFQLPEVKTIEPKYKKLPLNQIIVGDTIEVMRKIPSESIATIPPKRTTTEKKQGNFKLNHIYNENCLETMAKMPENFIDMTVTSPPYDDMRSYSGNTFNEFESIVKELYRVTKNGGVVVWVVGDQTIKGNETGTSFKHALYLKEVGFNLFDTMIYLKPPRGAVGSNKTYWQTFEYMFILSKGNPKTINLIKDRENKDERSGDNSTKRLYDGTLLKQKRGGYSKYGRRTNVWEYLIGKGHSASDKVAYEHPAIFPEKLAQDHIISWSKKGEIIYDPFMGSGTTVKMAILNNRKYIGSELSSKYCEITRKRIKNIQ